MEATTAKTLGYEAFTSISVPFFGVSRADAERCLERMPEFLANDRVVAMGEIGLDCGTEFEEWLFREHLRLAGEHELPVILHTPIRLAPQGATVTPRVFEIIKEEGFPVERCVFDHAGEETMEFRMSTGGMVGLSICWDKMPPEAAAHIVIDHPEWRDRIIINSELGGMGNDYFMVPRVQLAMKLVRPRQGDDRRGVLPDAAGLLQAAGGLSLMLAQHPGPMRERPAREDVRTAAVDDVVDFVHGDVRHHLAGLINVGSPGRGLRRAARRGDSLDWPGREQRCRSRHT